MISNQKIKPYYWSLADMMQNNQQTRLVPFVVIVPVIEIHIQSEQW